MLVKKEFLIDFNFAKVKEDQVQKVSMAQRLKRWESPRRRGRNDKGKGGSARQRQIKKQQQMLRKKLKEANAIDQKNNSKREEINFSSL